MGIGRGRDLAGDRGLADEVEAPHIGRGFRDRLVVPRAVVDEYRDRRLVFFDQAANRLALAAAAADHGRVEVVASTLFDPPLLLLGAAVGEDEALGLGPDRRHPGRAEERRGGKGGVSTGRSRWEPDNTK